MKVVIIGGGIAGMSLAILLNREGFEVSVNERHQQVPYKGNAFLMHSDGLSILEELFSGETPINLPGKMVDRFSLKRPNGEEIMYLKLKPWQCIKRPDLVNGLYDIMPQEFIHKNRDFSHFNYEGDKVIAAVFKNGEVEHGDIFVGSDGSNSAIRNTLFGATNYTLTEVKEVVGVCENIKIVNEYKGLFTKYLARDKSLSFGFIPSTDTEIVWFIQYNPQDADTDGKDPIEFANFCKTILKDFPEEVQSILNSNDFNTSYIWLTRDFDTLPAFHKQNVILIGDAGHLAVPFTSAGTTNAFVDAKSLVACLLANNQYENAFKDFYELRAPLVDKHLNLGRRLKADFLNFASQNDDKISVPLISNRGEYMRIKPEGKRIHLLYFTDPICSTCWVIQPELRKLKLEYGSYLEIEYCMGGLLPNWEGYERGEIKTPSDAANHWEDSAKKYKVEIDGDLWMEDPPESSFPPSIAFKAAQMQNMDQAIIFLRRINEMVFFEKKNIVKEEHIRQAAFDVGLDVARLMRDMTNDASAQLEDDLSKVKLFDVKVLPTFIFTDGRNNATISGFQSYNNFEEILKSFIPDAIKQTYTTHPSELFNMFGSLTTREFTFLTNLPETEVYYILENMKELGLIEKLKNKNGEMWKWIKPIVNA